jgi:hypothetical protein
MGVGRAHRAETGRMGSEKIPAILKTRMVAGPLRRTDAALKKT